MNCCDVSCAKEGYGFPPPKSPYDGQNIPTMEELFKYNVEMTVWIRLEFRNYPDEMERRLAICHYMINQNRECLDQRISERAIRNAYINKVFCD